MENLEKEVVAILVVSHKRDEHRRTVKYFKFNRWFGTQSKYLIAIIDHLPEFTDKIQRMGYDLFSVLPNSNYLKTSWTILYAADCEYDLDCVDDFGLNEKHQSDEQFYKEWHKLVLPAIVSEIVAEIGPSKCAVRTGIFSFSNLLFKIIYYDLFLISFVRSRWCYCRRSSGSEREVATGRVSIVCTGASTKKCSFACNIVENAIRKINVIKYQFKN